MKTASNPISLTGLLSDDEIADVAEVITEDWERFAMKYEGRVPAVAVNMVLLFSVSQCVSGMKSKPFLTEGAKRELKVYEYAVRNLLRDIEKVRRKHG